MSIRQVHLSENEIDQLLRRDLSAEASADLEAHLDDCLSCCEALEHAAAAPEQWRETREWLSSADWSPADDLSPGNNRAPRDSEARQTQPDDETRASLSHLKQLLDASDDPRMMGRFAGYEILGVIGQGGMGVVFKGFDAPLNRYVAIKVLAPQLAASPIARRRFAREAQAAAAVVHENVVAIHGVDQWRDLPYLVMTYVRGESLESRLRRLGPLSVPEILRVAMQCAAGLAAAHAQGLVHRDVKPGNILLEDGVERLRLVDFGLARAVDDSSVTRTGFIAGTPQYMSPEQARGESIDARSDLFGLGSVMYAMASGKPPFRGETSFAILRRIVESQPRPLREESPDVPAWLDAFIHKLLAKDPVDRLASAEQTADLLRRCLAHVQQPMISPLPDMVRRWKPPALSQGPGGLRNFTRRSRILMVVALACSLLIVAVNPPWREANELPRPGGDQGSHTTAPESSKKQSNPTGVPQADALSEAELQGDPLQSELDALWDDVRRLENELDETDGLSP